MFSPYNRVTSFDYDGKEMASFSHLQAVSGGNIGGFQQLGRSAPRRESEVHHIAGPSKQTLEPIVTGTSIIAVKYKDGVMLAGDTLASYGSLARIRDMERIVPIGKYTIIGGTGDMSDFQHITKTLENLTTSYDIVEDGSTLAPNSIHSYLTRVMYERRNKFDPLWNNIVVAGFYNGKSFLALSDLRGGSYADDTIATGYGNYIAKPLLRSNWRPNMTFEEAKKLVEDCLRVLYYRDARSFNRIQLATITEQGASVSQPYELETDWSVGEILYSGFNIRNL